MLENFPTLILFIQYELTWNLHVVTDNSNRKYVASFNHAIEPPILLLLLFFFKDYMTEVLNAASCSSRNAVSFLFSNYLLVENVNAI